MTTDYDGAWKEALEHYFHPFLDLCFADIATLIDWRVPVEFLDQWLIDWLMVLPREVAVALRRDLVHYETQKSMPYITSIEQLGREEGRQEGQLTGRQEYILETLATRFGEVPCELRERVQAVKDEATLKRLLRQAVLAPSLEAFTAALQP